MTIVSFATRAVLGLFFGGVFSFVGWMIARSFRAYSGSATYGAITALCIGGFAGVAVMLA